MPKNIPLTLACGNYEIVRSLLDGTVAPDGIDLTILTDMDSTTRHWRFLREGQNDPVLIWQKAVTVGTNDYFQTLHLRLKAGRWFGPEDDQKGAKTVVLDAHTSFAGATPTLIVPVAVRAAESTAV